MPQQMGRAKDGKHTKKKKQRDGYSSNSATSSEDSTTEESDVSNTSNSNASSSSSDSSDDTTLDIKKRRKRSKKIKRHAKKSKHSEKTGSIRWKSDELQFQGTASATIPSSLESHFKLARHPYDPPIVVENVNQLHTLQRAGDFTSKYQYVKVLPFGDTVHNQSLSKETQLYDKRFGVKAHQNVIDIANGLCHFTNNIDSACEKFFPPNVMAREHISTEHVNKFLQTFLREQLHLAAQIFYGLQATTIQRRALLFYDLLAITDTKRAETLAAEYKCNIADTLSVSTTDQTSSMGLKIIKVAKLNKALKEQAVGIPVKPRINALPNSTISTRYRGNNPRPNYSRREYSPGDRRERRDRSRSPRRDEKRDDKKENSRGK